MTGAAEGGSGRAGRRALRRLALVLVVAGSCARPQPRVARPPRPERANEPSKPWPDYPPRHGRAALRRAALACYEQGLAWRPEIFAKGGTLVMSWRADRDGHLLRLQFDNDSFQRWAIDANGETLAECVVRRAGDQKVEWSRDGVAPLRLSPPPPAADAGVPDASATDAGPAADGPADAGGGRADLVLPEVSDS